MKHASNRSNESLTNTRARSGGVPRAVLRVPLLIAVAACSSGPSGPGASAGALDSNNGADAACVASDGGTPPSDGGTPPSDGASDASPESACGTTVPSASQIVDAAGNVWTLTADAQIARNDVVDAATQNVVLLAYVKGILYQNAYDTWWGWINDAWQVTSDPRTGSPCNKDDAGAPPATPGALSYMVGFGGAGQSNKTIAAAEAALGRPFDLGTDAVSVDGFQFGPYTSSNGRAMGKILIFEVLSMSWDQNQGLQDMAQAASGAYDDVYTRMAEAMAAFGSPPVSVRIGHEMNGNWYPWSATDGNGHNATPANYIAAFKRIAQIVRKYNPTTLIEWCTAIQPSVPSWPGTSYTPLDYWVGAYDPVTNPGGADVITMDFYEGLSGTNFTNNILGGQFGLQWLAAFAQQNRVKIALSEVATGTSNSPAEGNGCPCSNDGTFMQAMIDWINARPAGQFTHFAFSPWAPADDLTSSGNAAIQNVWKKNWGGTHFEGTWWKGPKVPTQP